MKPDYKNWMPKGMVLSAVIAAAVFLLLFVFFGLTGIVSGTLKTVLFIVFLFLTVVCICVSVWMIMMYRAFDYNGKRKMSRQIIPAPLLSISAVGWIRRRKTAIMGNV